MHKVHHHFQLPLTDTNYGNIFSFWDRLFGTFKTLNPSKIIYGVDTFFNEEENVDKFYKEIKNTIGKIGISFELIFFLSLIE